MAALDGCGLLVAAERGRRSSGIWFVGRDGRVDRVLAGRYSDFAVQPGGEMMAVLTGDADSLRLVRQPFEDRFSCSPDAF